MLGFYTYSIQIFQQFLFLAMMIIIVSGLKPLRFATISIGDAEKQTNKETNRETTHIKKKERLGAGGGQQSEEN